MDWNAFTFEYVLDQSDFWKELIQIEGYKEGALNLILPPNWSLELDRLNRIRAVHGTTALEGNPLSEAEVSQQIELIDRAGVTPSNHLAPPGYSNGIGWRPR